MRASNKSSFITGAALLLLAALFTISLILLPLDYGVAGPGHSNIFYMLGDMLYSVYGFCSILIPGFLLTAGLSCFASKWTARKTLRLLTALVPFFTCVVTESIIRSILKVDFSSFKIVKILIALVTGAMLVVIEFLGTGIIADRLNTRGFRKAAVRKSSENENDESILKETEDADVGETAENFESTDSEASDINQGFTKISKLSAIDSDNSEKSKKSLFEKLKEKFKKNEDSSDDANESYDGENIPKLSIFDEVLSDIEPASDIGAEADADDETEIEEQDAPAFEDYKNAPDSEVYYTPPVIPAAKTENQKPAQTISVPAATQDEEESDSSNPNSIITQEEFAALTTPEDELEWPDLPPKPESLPPEYDADFDENDPALTFPPVDDVESESKQAGGKLESSGKLETGSKPETAPVQPAVTQHSASAEATVEAPVSAEESKDNSNDPYAAVRYIDTVVENPKFPHKIVIHDESTPAQAETEEKKTSANNLEKPKFPTRIQLTDENSVSESETKSSTEAADQKENYQSVGSYFNDVAEPKIATKENLYNYFENVDTKKTAPKIQEPVVEENSEQTAEPEISIDDNFADDEPQIFNQLALQEEQETVEEDEVDISRAAASVFSDMEADIRKNSPAPAQVSAEKNAEEPAADHSAEPAASSKAQAGNTPNHGATNLTKDELSDFFNAQQEENRPHTKEIAANPPKTNRATKKGPYIIPSDLLTAYKDDQYWIIDDATKQASLNLKQTLAEFNIEADIIGIKKGPVVTMFEILPAPGVKLSKIVALQDNIALSLAAQSVRIVAPIPGKQAVGIEVPNRNRSVVGFREIIEMDLPEWKKMAVPVVLGKDILGKAQLIDLVKTPHMLIAGATGSGKSVCVNSLILSILYKRSFEDVKMILVDPKVVELKLYNNIPHLLTPVITEPKKALQALQWCLCEMERRYALLDGMGVRDISNYNKKIKEQKICTEKLPYIVVIIDEFADLMATSGKELENIVARLTAMSRAVGIHLVLATQRPSVNVITGLIKANIPTRIAFMVASRTDSNIIIDTVGAEKLLGRGDMLYASAVDPAPIRIQGTFVSDQEVENVVTAVKDYGEPDYIDEEIFVDDDDEEGARDLFGEPMDDDDPLYDQALEIVVQSGKASASYLQRRLKIGYNRAARLVEEMEERGIVGPANGAKPREVIHVP